MDSKEMSRYLSGRDPDPKPQREAANGGGGNGDGGPGALYALRVASDLIARSQLAAKAGLTFGGSRDLYDALGYPRSITLQDYRERYRRGGIAARVVEAYPNATWRGGIEIVEDEDPDVSTEFEGAWEELNDRLGVWPRMNRADILSGLGRYATLLIGAPGELEEELPSLNGQGDILYLMPFAEDEASIDQAVSNVEDPRYGMPEFYKLKRKGSRAGEKLTLDKRVHWTRVVHLADGLLDDDIYGLPRLERVWNHLDELDKITGGGSEAFWLRVNQGTILNVEPGIKVEAGELAKLKEEAEEFAHQMRRILAARGLTATTLPSTVSPFATHVASLISLVSGASGIPQRLLLGSERGELASTQDRENWNDRVMDRRNTFAEPVVRSLIGRLMEHGGLPEAEYSIRWPKLADMTEAERAEIADKWAGLNKKSGGTVVMADEIRDRVLGLESLEEAGGVPNEGLSEEELEEVEVVGASKDPCGCTK